MTKCAYDPHRSRPLRDHGFATPTQPSPDLTDDVDVGPLQALLRQDLRQRVTDPVLVDVELRTVEATVPELQDRLEQPPCGRGKKRRKLRQPGRYQNFQRLRAAQS